MIIAAVALIALAAAPCRALDRNRDISNELSLAKTGFAHAEAARFDDARSCFEIVMSAGVDSGNSYLQGLARFGKGMIHYRKAEYTAALDELTNAVELLSSATKKQRPALARAYLYLARTQLTLNRLDDAFTSLETGYQLVARGVPTRERAEAVQLSAELFLLTGRRAQAKLLLAKLLDERAALLGSEHPDVAESSLVLGSIYELDRDYPAARGYYTAAARIYENVYGKDNPATARAYAAIGAVASLSGDFPAAAVFLNRAMDIQEQTLGRMHPDHAATSASLAKMYLATGMRDNARNAIGHSLDADKLAFGEKSLAYARDLAILGEVYRENMTLHKAEEAQRQVLDILAIYFDEKSPALTDALNALSATLYYSAKWEEAMKLQRRALEIDLSVPGKPDPDAVIASFNNMGALADSMKDYRVAEAHYLQAIDAEKTTPDGNILRLASMYHNLAMTYLNLKDDAKAAAAFEESLKLMRWDMGQKNEFVADEYYAAAECHRRLGNGEQAEKYYKTFLRLADVEDRRAAPTVELLKKMGRWYDPEPSPKYYEELRVPNNQ